MVREMVREMLWEMPSLSRTTRFKFLWVGTLRVPTPLSLGDCVDTSPLCERGVWGERKSKIFYQ